MELSDFLLDVFAKDDDFYPETDGDNDTKTDVPLPLPSLEPKPVAKPRFKPVDQEMSNALAAAKNSKETDKQTKWAVKAFKGYC